MLQVQSFCSANKNLLLFYSSSHFRHASIAVTCLNLLAWVRGLPVENDLLTMTSAQISLGTDYGDESKFGTRTKLTALNMVE